MCVICVFRAKGFSCPWRGLYPPDFFLSKYRSRMGHLVMFKWFVSSPVTLDAGFCASFIFKFFTNSRYLI